MAGGGSKKAASRANGARNGGSGGNGGNGGNGNRLSLLNRMWLGTKGGDTSAIGKEVLFTDLYAEVRGAAPSAQLSYNLRCRLERCDREDRRAICSRVKDSP